MAHCICLWCIFLITTLVNFWILKNNPDACGLRVFSPLIISIINSLYVIQNLFKYLFLYIKIDLKQLKLLEHPYIQAHKITINRIRVNIYSPLVNTDMSSGERYV